MTLHPQICFLIPYFGTWPFWFPFFLESCRANPDINWVFYTDCEVPENLPPNVRIVGLSFATYCELVSDALKIDFHPTSPYKLCDLKPALGYVHQRDLAGFEFWAFSDIDLIYGNLRKYFTAERLSGHDLFSTHIRRIAGHCCILRNTKFINEAFMQIGAWRELLSSPAHQWFDESAFSRLFIRHKNWPKRLNDFIKPWNRWTRCIENIEAFSTPYARIPWIDGTYDFPTIWYWDNGKLTNNKDNAREFPYFHFIVWKKELWRNNQSVLASATVDLATSRRWIISEEGFAPLV